MGHENYAEIWKSGSLLTFESRSQTKPPSLSPIYSDKIFIVRTCAVMTRSSYVFKEH